jgi:hypothetical protein
MLEKQKKILFITTSNLTTNPRLAKEIENAIENGYRISVICFKYKNWSGDIEVTWLKEHPEVNAFKISAERTPFLIWFQSTFVEWLSRKMYPLMNQTMCINAFASSKRSFLIKNYLSKYYAQIDNIDLIISHNLGALYPAWKYAKEKNIPFIFDVEDYHPGEQIERDVLNERHRREFLLKKLLPQAACVTSASPFIGQQIKSLVGKFNIQSMIIINNCFSSHEFEYIESKSRDVVHFVWFSQNIAPKRGLELIIPEFAKHKDKVHLHLIGNLYPGFNQEWILPNQDFITTHAPLPQEELNHFICQFDIGLALELQSADENRQICLTNKIWAYLQAGLFILASDTPAQIHFMREHREHVSIFSTKEFNSLSKTLNIIFTDIEKIRKTKLSRFTNAKKFAWDVEKRKIQKIWQEILI